ncbi:type IV pilus biogenesis/stability protein PilW [Colwelliaceae bacterium BS250]
MPKIVRKTSQSLKQIALVCILGSLSACVTQNFAEDKPVVDRDYNNTQVAVTRISLALSYLNKGHMTQAKSNLEKAKKLAPNMPEVYTAFAHYYEKVGEYDKAEASYNEALSLDENSADTLNNLGVFLCRQSRVDEAEQAFLKAIEVPTYVRVSESYENIALCYLKENNFDKAEYAIKRSIDHSPNSASSLMQMAQIKYAKADYEQSEVYLSRYEFATRRFTPQAIALAYKVNLKLGEIDVANSYATMLLEMFPQSTQAMQYLDNELEHIAADDLALEYRKYKLLQSGVEINQKPIIVKRKVVSKQIQPAVVVATPANNKSLNTATNVVNGSPTVATASNQLPASNVASKSITPANTAAPIIVSTTPKTTKANANNTKATTNSVVNSPVIANVPTTKPVANASAASIDGPVHIVVKGDNLYQVSLKYNIMISSIRRWNDLKQESIHVGQVLRLTKP